jgi:hypothetical protein
VRWPPAREDVIPEAGERPLVKTQQAVKLVRAVVNCRMCELVIAL